MNWIAKPDEHGRIQRRSLTEFVGRPQRSWIDTGDDGEPVERFEEPRDGEVVVTLPDEPLLPSTALLVAEDGSTSVVEDHIGSIFYRVSDGGRVEIEQLGPIPAGLIDQPPPSHSTRAAVSFDDGVWTVSEPLDALTDLLAYAADLRWRVEQGGTEWNGWPIHTDDRSQGKYLSELQAIALDVRVDGDPWKFADGVFRPVSNTDFPALAIKAREHARTAFGIEGAVQAQIEAGTFTTREQIADAFSSL